MKKQAIIVGLLVVILFSFSMTVSGIALLSGNRLAGSPSTNQNLLDFATAAAPSVKIAPIPAPAVPITPIERIFLAGGSSINPLNHAFRPSVNKVISSNDGVSYTQLTASALWSPRSNHTLTSFFGLLFVMGGANPHGPGPYTEYNDVYVTIDGSNWIQWLTNAPWAPRSGHDTILLNGQLFLMGGSTWLNPNLPRTYLNDVWSSPDGQNWTFLGNAPWAGRDRFASVIFNNQIFVIGGKGHPQSFADVWSSPDGINWIQHPNAPWSSFRHGHSALVFNGKIYLIGGGMVTSGFLTNDVWSSVDGTNWVQETASAPWSTRMDHVSLVFDGYMWVIGGLDYSGTVSLYNIIYTDAWKSRDGINWTRATTNIPNLNGDGFAGVVLP